MATYTTDFAGGTVGQPPAGFTTKWQLADDGDWRVIEEATAPSGKAVQSTPGATNLSAWHSMDAAGVGAEDLELLALVKNQISFLVRGSGEKVDTASNSATNSDTGYVIRFRNGNFWVSLYDDGYRALSLWTQFWDGAWGPEVWFKVRVRVRRYQLAIKVWVSTDAEPAAWSLVLGIPSTKQPGWVGFGLGSEVGYTAGVLGEFTVTTDPPAIATEHPVRTLLIT